MFKKIGFIGIGVMGKSMAAHLMDAYGPILIYSRTKSKAEDLISRGAIWKDSVKEIAQEADLIFTIVGYPSDVESIYLSEDGLVNNAKEGTFFCDMTTTTPSLEMKIAEQAAKRGCKFFDAPVSGGDVGARNATLTIMLGGDKDSLDDIIPYLEKMGKSINYMGKAGMGQHTKMCNQIVISGTMIGVSEALVYGKKAGLDVPAMIDAIRPGAAGCWTLDNLAPRVVKNDFAPGFMIDHFIKDMKIALEESKAMNIELKGLALVEKLYEKLQEEGYGKDGTQALVKAVEATAKEV